MLKCGHDTQALVVTATINNWDACDSQVKKMNWDNELIEDWVSSGDHEVTVGWTLCPICKRPTSEPWIEDFSVFYPAETNKSNAKYLFKWYWKKKCPERKGHRCAVLAYGKMNSVLVEFESDRYRMITSRFAVRKIKREDL